MLDASWNLIDDHPFAHPIPLNAIYVGNRQLTRRHDAFLSWVTKILETAL